MNLSEILIFKTNIRTAEDVSAISAILNNHSGIKDWNVDVEDIDCVLRIVSNGLTKQDVISLILNVGYNCQELV